MPNQRTQANPSDAFSERHRHLLAVQARIKNVGNYALKFVPHNKAVEQAKQWMVRAVAHAGIHGYSPEIAAMVLTLRSEEAFGYALDLALFTPSLATRKTAVDRLIHSGELTTQLEKDAAQLLSRSTFRMLKLVAVVDRVTLEMQDLASGEILQIVGDANFMVSAGARHWMFRTCAYDGMHLAVAANTPVDDKMLKIATPYLHQDGLKNPLKCMELLYRYYVSVGAPTEFLAQAEAAVGSETVLPFNAGTGPMHALAADWAAQESVPEPDSDTLGMIRSWAYQEAILDGLYACWMTREHGYFKLFSAYERIVLLQMETLHRRRMSGIRCDDPSMDDIIRELQQEITANSMPASALQLFEAYYARVRISAGAAYNTTTSRAQLDKVLLRIQALRSKTVGHGCTEEEALGAASKVAELLERYGLSLSEVEFKEQQCAGEGIVTSRRNLNALDMCLGDIAQFCDCRHWMERTAHGHIQHIFFGLPADVAGARCIYDKIEEAFETETAHFKRTKTYIQHDQGGRRQSTRSFQAGMQAGICIKLEAVKKQRNELFQHNYGRSLVPLKSSLIEDEIAVLGLKLTATMHATAKQVLSEAYHHGTIAGQAIQLEDVLEEVS